MSSYELKQAADSILKANGYKWNGQKLGTTSNSVWSSASAGIPGLGK